MINFADNSLSIVYNTTISCFVVWNKVLVRGPSPKISRNSVDRSKAQRSADHLINLSFFYPVAGGSREYPGYYLLIMC